MIITLCGSTKFKDIYDKIAKILTLKGHLIFSCNCFIHSEFDKKFIKKILKSQEILREVHKNKIDLSDLIIVLNKNDYIGFSTYNEIKYALSKDKKVLFLEKTTFYEVNRFKEIYDKISDNFKN